MGHHRVMIDGYANLFDNDAALVNNELMSERFVGQKRGAVSFSRYHGYCKHDFQ